MALGKLLINLGANISQFESDMGRAARIAKKESDRIKNQIDVAMKAVVTSAVAAGAGLATLVKKTANAADNIQKLSQRLGASTEFLSQMRHTTELTGVQFNSFTTALQRMTRRLSEVANTGKGEAAPALEALGITAKSIKDLAPEQQMLMIADAMKNVSSQGERVRIAMKLFDTEGVALVQTLQNGSQAIIDMNKEADAFGLTISQSAADSAAQFNDELSRLKSQLAGAAQSVALELLPEITDLITEFRKSDFVKSFADNIKSTIGFFKDISGEIELTVKALTGLFIASKITTAWRVMTATMLAAEAATKGMTVAAGTLTATLSALKGTVALLGGPLGVIALGAVALNEWVDATAEGRSHTDEFRKATDKLAQSFRNLGIEQRKSQIVETRFNLQDAQAELDNIKQINAELGISSNRALRDAQASVDNLSERLKLLKSEYVKLLKPVEDIKPPVDETKGSIDDFTNSTNTANVALKAAQSTLEGLRRKHRPIQTMFRDLAQSMENLNIAIPDLSAGEYQEGLELIQDEAEAMAKNIVGQVEDIYKQIPFLMGEAVEEAEKADLSRMFDNFASGLNPAIGALQAFKDEIATINELTKKGKFTAGQQAFYSTGLAAEFALNSMASMAEEGSRAQAKLQAAAAVTNTLLGIAAVLEQGKGDPYTAFARMAAMAALVASLGVQVAGAFGGSGAGGAEQRQETQGTGTVLGDSSAKSESIVNALDTIANASEKIVGINSKMLRSLDAMNDAISGTVNEIGKLGTIGDLGTTASTALGGLDSFLFGSSKVTDRGIEILSGSISDAINGDIFQAYEIAKKKGLFGSSRRINTAALDEGITNQISLIFESMADTVLAGAEALGVNLEGVQAALDAYQIEEQRISLLDLDPEEQRAELEAVFSSIFDGLVSVSIPFIEQFQQAGEGLGETLARVSTTVLVFEEAIGSMGLDFIAKELDPELFAQAAVSIAEFAGGMESFIDGYTSYINNFLTEAEQLEIVTDRISGVFADLGLSLPDTRQGFTELIQGLDLTTEAGQEAFGMLIGLSSQIDSYYSGVEQAQQEAIQAQERLASLIANTSNELENMDLSSFALRLKEIRKAFNENVRSARELGASERQLAAIQELASRQIRQAVLALENDISGALTDLYGTELDRINEQIALLESQESQIGSVQQASDNLYESQLRAIQDIQSFVRGLLLDEQLSPLNPQQQLAEAQSQFDALLAAAQGGDVDALNQLPALAQTLLGFGQDVFASSQDYVDIFNSVTESLSSLGVTASPQQDPQQVIIGQNQQLIELQQERNRLEAEFDLDSHRQAVLAVAEQIREWASASDESFTQLAERLGIPVEQFLTDLGVSLDELTVETALALGETAQLLGIEITDLAESVGLSLGSLADDQSLLNDALEQTILSLPQGIAQDLDAMLSAIERSTDPAAREELLADMVNYIDELAPEFTELLAPYFDDIDPITEAQAQINQMETLNLSNTEIRDEVRELRAQNQTNAANIETIQTSTRDEISRLADEVRVLNAIRGVS